MTDKLLKIFPDARNVHCDTEMSLAGIPDYESGGGGGGNGGGENPWNDISTKEPSYFWRSSPNKSSRSSPIKYIILHNTAGSFAGAVSWLCNPQAQASAHLVIPRSGGEIAALVNETDAA